MAGPSFAIFLLVPLLLLGVSGAVLLFLGLRGRRESDHPHCRKCRFDLQGIYPGATGERGGKCPECGAELVGPKAVRSGLRRPRIVMAAIGAFLMLIPIGALTATVVIAARRTDLNPYKPAWMLVWEVEHRDPGDMVGQLKELTARLTGKQLDAPTVSGLVARCLEVQADPKSAWLVAWGDFIEAARPIGAVSDEQFGAYGKNAVAVTALLRSRVVEGDPWVFEMSVRGVRAGSGGTINLKPRMLGVNVGDELTLTQDSGAGMLGIGSGGAGSVQFTQKVKTAPGEHAVKTRWAMAVTEGWSSPPLVEWEETLDGGKVTVLPAGSSTVELVDEPSLRGRVEASIPKGKIQITAPAPNERGGSGPGYMGFVINCDSPPMPLAFDVILRRTAGAAAGKGQKEWKFSSVTFTASGGSHSTSTGGYVTGFDEQAVDVLLRPSVKAAQATVGITQIWNGEIVIEGVPVKWPPAPVPEETAK